MKRIIILIAILLMFLSSCNTGGSFTITDENIIIAPDGTEYIFLANEGLISSFDSTKFLGKIKGEKASFIHLSSRIKTGLFSFENDPNNRILIRNVPDNEWRAYYRKATLPKLELTPDNCIRFELIKGSVHSNDINNISCDDGIINTEEIKAFLSDVRSQKTVYEAGLYDLVRKPDGMLENCYEYGTVYGYFKDEPNLAIPLYVTSYNDKAYSISLDEKEYVLPEKWLSELEKCNP